MGERLEEAYIKVVARRERWDGREVGGAEGLDEDTGEDIPQPNNPMACTRLFIQDGRGGFQ